MGMDDLAKLRSALAWLKTCPPWQRLAAAESALDKVLDVMGEMNARLDALERGGKHGEGEGGRG